MEQGLIGLDRQNYRGDSYPFARPIDRSAEDAVVSAVVEWNNELSDGDVLGATDRLLAAVNALQAKRGGDPT